MNSLDPTSSSSTAYQAPAGCENDKETKQLDPADPVINKMMRLQISIGECLADMLNNEIKSWKLKVTSHDPEPDLAEKLLSAVEEYSESSYAEFKKNLSIEQQKNLLKTLPLWVESHFSTQSDQFKEAFEGLYLDFEGKTDDEIIKNFNELEESLSYLLCRHTFSLALRGMTIPEDNKDVAIVAEHVIYLAWQHAVGEYEQKITKEMRKIIEQIFPSMREEKKSYSDGHAWCNGKVITHDSYRMLLKVLKKQNNFERKFILSDLENIQMYPKLVMHLGFPAFTISVGGPSSQ